MTHGCEAPAHVLREYALLADGERGAVLGPHGDIAWLCAPRWDSGSVFSGLIGGTGTYQIVPLRSHVWGGEYEGASMIWRDRWVTTEGIVECREALAYPADQHRVVLLRRPSVQEHTNRLDVVLRPRGGYDTEPMSDAHREGDAWTARVGGLYLRWSGAREARTRDHGRELHLTITLGPGEHRDLVLELSDQPLPDELPHADELWRGTAAQWQRTVPEVADLLAPGQTRRSLAVLHGLTSAGGGMVAAATTSLPERSEAGRNYDYRYVWIRDQCYAGQAAAACGDDLLLDAAVRLVTERMLAHGDRLAPAYTTLGERVPDQRHLDLPGYPGGFDLIGNHVNEQFQLDALGEVLLLLAAAARADRVESEQWAAADAAAEAIERRWNEPDAGIWELDARAWTQSRLIASAGLRAVAAIAPSTARGSEWLAAAEHILADTTGHALSERGHWQRTPDDARLDAALLWPGIRGAVPPDDPRTRATLDAYLDELTDDGYAYRFRHDQRPLHEAEGSFLLCGFLVAIALHDQGDVVEARAWYERIRAACGPPQLFSEEYDAHQHQMRGNLPQAFVHAIFAETSAHLAHEGVHP